MRARYRISELKYGPADCPSKTSPRVQEKAAAT